MFALLKKFSTVLSEKESNESSSKLFLIQQGLKFLKKLLKSQTLSLK